MCWGEQTILACPYCHGVTTQPTRWLGCPFDQPHGSCTDAFVTTNHTVQSHTRCLPITPTVVSHNALRLNTAVGDTWDVGSPHYTPVSPSNSRFIPPAELPSYTLPLPHGWTADANPQAMPSDTMTLVTQYRSEMIRTLQDLVEPVMLLRRSVPLSNTRLNRVINWSEDYVVQLVCNADSYIWFVQQAENEVANNTINANTARADLLRLANDCRNLIQPFEGPLVWHRRFTDLIVHLRRVAGELSPSRAPTEFVRTHRRRGAVSEADGALPFLSGDFGHDGADSSDSDDDMEA